jgi:hypothetical protein
MLCVLALLAAAPSTQALPPVAVVVSSRRDPANKVAPELTRRMREALTAVGLTLWSGQEPSAVQCEGAPVCLGAVGAAVGGGFVVVGVDAGRVASVVAAHFEAVFAGEDVSLANGDLAGDAAKWSEAARPALEAFALRLLTQLRARAAASAPAPPPVPPPAVPMVAVESPPSRVQPLTIGLGAGALAGLAVTLGLGVATVDARNRYTATLYDRGMMTASMLPDSALRAQASEVNARATAALISGIVTAALAAVTVWLFIRG